MDIMIPLSALRAEVLVNLHSYVMTQTDDMSYSVDTDFLLLHLRDVVCYF